MADLNEIISYLDEFLEVGRFKDYAPNGLQVEGRKEIKKIVTGVTASLALIEAAIAAEADALFVHHGYFWSGEAAEITGMKQRRIKLLLQHDISLLAYHLPLDAHPEIGNNAGIAKLLGLQTEGVMDKQGVGNYGFLSDAISLFDFTATVKQAFDREPLVIKGGEHQVKHVAWCSGGAQKYLIQAAQLGADVYISGEISENTVHEARELGIHYISAGHHATERYGVENLGRHIAEKFAIDQVFIDIFNPV